MSVGWSSHPYLSLSQHMGVFACVFPIISLSHHRLISSGPPEYGSSDSALLFGRSSQLGGFGAAVAYSGGIFWQGKLLTNS